MSPRDVETGAPTVPEIPTRYGVLEAFNPDEDLISRWLSKYGEWAQLELAFIAECLTEGDRIADIGAFLGTFGLGISKLKSVGKICFVDANPVVVPLLRKNVERNLNVSSVVIEAVVGGDGAQRRGTGVQGNIGSFSVAGGDTTGREIAQCSTGSVSLRTLSDDHGPFDFYKIDAEGMEGAILRQDLGFLAQTQSTFWVECNSTPASLDVAQFLLDQGFKVFYFAFPAISPNNFNCERDREFPYAYEAGLWASKTRTPTVSKELLGAGCALKAITDVQALRRALWLTSRWSPAGWENRPLHEVVALATHALLGEDYETFLSSAGTEAVVPRWADPLPVRLQQRIDAYQQRLAESECTLEAAKAEIQDNKTLIRAHEIVLHKERERSRSAIKGLESELLALQAQTAVLADQLSQVYRSRSWRMTMPVRMLGRVARGDYRELRRLIKAKFFAS